MKSCSECGATYEDDMSFCLEDGTQLVLLSAGTEAVTEKYEFPIQTSLKQSETLTEDWSNSQASKATVIKQPDQLTNASATLQTTLTSEPNKSRGGIFIAMIGFVGLLLFGSAIGGIYWYFTEHKPIEIASNTSNQSSNHKSNPSDGGMAADLSNANLQANANRTETKVAENSNAETIPTPKETPKPEASKTPDKTVTPTVKPTPETTIEEVAKPTPTPDRIPRIISGGVLNGKATNLPQPPYPPAARAVNAKGAVNVQVLVNENGKVTRARAVSGHPLLRNAAEQAARRASFQPTQMSGQAVKVTGIIVYNFN